MIREQAVPSDSAAWLGIASNVILAVFKGVVGLLFDSRVLLADALYSASDAAAGIAGKFELLPDKHRRQWLARPGAIRGSTAEPLMASFFAVFLFMGALHMGISSISSILTGDVAAPGYMAGVAIVISIALREMVFRLQHRQSRKRPEASSQAYIHMHKNSLYCSIVVLLGVFGAMCGEAWDLPVLLYMDPAAALIVACIVVWKGFRLIFGAVYGGKRESRARGEDKMPFIETVQRVHGVITVDELKLKDDGYYISIAAIISVNPRISVLEANHIANRAKILLLNRFSQVSDVSIQVMPYDPGYPYKSNYEGSNNDLPTLLQ